MHNRSAASSRLLLAIGLVLVAACQGTCFTPPAESLFSVDFVHPTDRQVLGLTDDADVDTPGFQYTVEVTGADSEGRTVTLEAAALETRLTTETVFVAGGTPVLSGATATFASTTLRQGSNVIRVSATEQGSGRQASRQITVDVQIGRPQVQAITFQGDADGDGVLNQAEQATGDPVVVVTTAGLEDGQPVVIKDQATMMTTYGTGTASGGSATVTLSGLMATDTTEASFDLVAEVTDRGGRTNKISNPTPSEPLNAAAFKTLKIDRVVPELTVLAPTGTVSPIQLHMVDDADPATPGFQVRVKVLTSADVGTDGVSITRTPSGQVTALTPDPVTREATLDFTVPEAGPFDYTFDLRVADPAKNTRTGQAAVRIGEGGSAGFFKTLEFSDNTLLATPAGPFKFNVNRQVAFGGSKAIVTITNEHYWNAPDQASLPATHIIDQDLATPGAQVILSGSIASGSTCVPKLLYGGVEKAAGATLATNTPTVVRLTATLDSNTSGPLQLAADCGGGKLFGSLGTALTVDIEPPAAITPALTLLNTGAFSDRRPGINVTWPASNDDGASGGGTAAGYVVRWSTDAAAPYRSEPPQAGDYDAKPGIDSEADFFDPRVSAQVGGVFSDTMRTTQITGLPSFGAFYVQVRAKDDVGNLGLMPATSCVPSGGLVTGTCIDHQLSVATITNNGLTEGNIGFLLAAGNVNGDMFDDLVFVSNTRSSLPAPPVPQNDSHRQAWIAYGTTDMSAFATVTAANQIPVPASTLDPLTGFYDVTIANVGDRAGDAATADVILASPTWNGRRGRYLIVFGRPAGATLDTANPVEIRGLGPLSNLAVGTANDIGYARPVADFGRPGGGPPDGLAELAISADNENGGNGRVYLFYGRPHDPTGGPGSWEALRVTDTDGLLYVPVTAADRVFDGEAGPLCTTCSPQTSQSFYGTRKGYVTLGDITNDGIPDLGIPASRDFVNRMYLYSGAAVNAATGPIAAAGAAAIQVLQGPNPSVGNPTGTLRGLGSDGAGGVELVAGPGEDLVLGYPRNNSLSIYPNATASGYAAGTPPFVINGNITRFGNSIVPADVNGDGRLDLIVGTNAGVSIGDGFPGGAYVFYQSATAGAEFETTRTALQVSWLKKGRAETLPSDSMGIAVAAGDFNGDSRVDVVVSDHRMGAPTSTNQGKIFIRY